MNTYTMLILLSCSASVHIIMTMVMGLYSRHKIQYLCLAWVNGIFSFTLLGTTLICEQVTNGQPGMLHPLMLLFLVVISYLQSIYPLSIPMPGFLQMRRMVKYARPALLIISLYVIGMLLGSKFVVLQSVKDIQENLVSSDVLLRLAAWGLSVYYIVNIFRLPHHMAHSADVPGYLLGYCSALGFSAVYYIFMTIFYNAVLIAIYVVIFTFLNIYLVMRTLETMAKSLPKPDIAEVQEAPSEELVEKAEHEDFNEANYQRFQRIEYWMQNNKEQWTDNTFGRDRLCKEVGYNRHLILQSIRSQGYNNVHDYINTYRVHELKRLIQRGVITSVSECSDAGFGAPKTARASFEKIDGGSLDAYLERYNIKS